MNSVLRTLIKGLLCFALVSAIFFGLQTTAQAAQVTLAWDANDPVPDGYRLFQRSASGTYNYSSPAWSGAGTTCTLSSLTDGATYYFVVRAYDGTDESGDSNEVSFQSTPPAPTTYTITATAGANGAITPAGASSVTSGGSRAYTIAANTGYSITSVLADGVSVGAVATYTFSSVSANHTISASFTANTYTITATANANGSITPVGASSVTYNGSRAYTITANTGYSITSVLVDGVSVGTVSSYTFSNVTANHTISATFAANTYTITGTAGANGSITPAGASSVTYGGSRAYTITANTGYRVASVLVDGVSVGAVATYTFSSVSANHTISASFTANTYTITGTAGANGSITPAGASSVTYNGSRAYTITANTGYSIAGVLVDGVSVGAVASYTFSSVSANHTITANFQRINQAPVADAGPDQTVDETQQVALSGLSSNDPDDGIAAFQWRQIQGPTVQLSAATAPETTFTAPDVDIQGQALIFELTITDFSGVTVVDSCIVNVSWVNMPPTAVTGGEQTVYAGDQVVLDASHSSDPDSAIATYHWVQSQGPVVTLSDAGAAQPFFTAPEVGVQGASILFELSVTDAGGLQDTDSCVVNIVWNNEPPVADAGVDQSLVEGTQVTLNGSGSMDPDDGISAYQWHQTDGVPVTLSDNTAVSPIFTAPGVGSDGAILIFQLMVTDYNGLQSADYCQVVVRDTLLGQADVTLPSISIVDPSGSQVTVNRPKITISGTASDNVRVDRVVWAINSGATGSAQGTTQWQIADLRLKRGNNTITVTAYDAAGNHKSATIVVYAGLTR